VDITHYQTLALDIAGINISKELKKYGKGFSRSNLTYMRLLYIKFPKSETLSHKLSWSHYFEILKVENDLARSFYEKQCILENWSVRELKRQKQSMLFERFALGKNKEEIIELSHRGQSIQKAEDIVKEPYILEFLGISEPYSYSELELEQKIIDNLQMFLLELGKGFTFVKRQFRISFDSRHHYIDLVFYHRILKCFVLIDLKIGEADHSDIGQMNMYLNYFKMEENTEGDNEPIGIILSAEKNDIKMEYAMGGITNQMFVSKYQLYLPKLEELELEIEKFLLNNEQ
jgi:predicted nuclease of restriction endonuclease-like (RecB) superfamily